MNSPCVIRRCGEEAGGQMQATVPMPGASAPSASRGAW